jgi:DNA-binding PadR family transcriptional regulator
MPDRDPRSLLPLTHLSYQILLALADGDRHGYGIIKEVHARTEGEMELETGTLYTALKRMKDEGLIDIVGEDDRRRVYALTAFGADVLEVESRRLAALVRVAVAKRVIPQSTA